MSKIMDIIYHPSPILRQVAKKVNEGKIRGKSMQNFLADMKSTMIAKDGAGLAAPQVGVSERIIIINDQNKKGLTMINPIITRRSWKKIVAEEGCLSVVDESGAIIYGKVERHKSVTCQYFDEQGKKKKIKAEDYLARVIQHEIDHLDGLLFIDHLLD